MQAEKPKFTLITANLKFLGNSLTPDLIVYDLERTLTANCFRCWSSGLKEREYQCNKLQGRMCTSARYEGLRWQLLGTVFNVAEGNFLYLKLHCDDK